jgi:hypothetical protein
MIELLSSIVVEFSRLTLFRRCGNDSNSKDVVKLNGNKIVAEEVLALRLVAIIDVPLEDIRIYSVNQNKSMNYQYLWNSILHRKFCNH